MWMQLLRDGLMVLVSGAIAATALVWVAMLSLPLLGAAVARRAGRAPSARGPEEAFGPGEALTSSALEWARSIERVVAGWVTPAHHAG
ncbi:MAG: hypothetical protein ACYDH5_05640 [Acidimicrobiales bacterium]